MNLMNLMNLLSINMEKRLMNKMKVLYLTIGVFFLLQNKMTFASNEFLFVRTAVGGGYEVVVQGTVENVCQGIITNTPQVMINGFSIQIETINVPLLPCFIPISPPRVYSVVAPLGKLTPGQYSITWSQPDFFTGSIQFNVSTSSPFPVPTLSPMALIFLSGLFLSIFYYKKNKDRL